LLSVTGTVTPETVKPVPATDAALTVTGDPPVEVRIKDCVDIVFRLTEPNATLVAFTVNVAAGGVSSTAYVLETPPALAVSITACAAVTDDTVAVKLALVAPAATVTVVGTVIAVLLLERLTFSPPVGAAAFRVTVQTSVPAPVKDELPHVNALNAAVEPAAAVYV
jgi:hypothetical protein